MKCIVKKANALVTIVLIIRIRITHKKDIKNFTCLPAFRQCNGI